MFYVDVNTFKQKKCNDILLNLYDQLLLILRKTDST